MANKDIIIPFQYCRLDRAARLLNCESSDLLNLGIRNKLSICVYLDNSRAVLNMNCDVELANKWYAGLSRASSVFVRRRMITEYSDFNIFPFSVDDDEEPVSVPLFTESIHDDTCFSNIGVANGLWRVSWGLEDIQKNGVGYFDGTEFEPCLPAADCPAVQLIFCDSEGSDDDSEPVEKETIGDMKVTYDDLWITAFDVKRIINCQSDYYNLEESIYGGEHKERIKSKSEIHHSAERHAGNREKILMAALRLREQQVNVFEESCRKPNGDINFSAWARELMARPDWFAGGEPPIKAETKIAEILSTAHKSPSEKKV